MEVIVEKKGDILNQLAIIADLLEKMNLESENRTIVIQLERKEFERIYKLIMEKKKTKPKKVNDTFTISIGVIDVVFNMNNA